MQASILQWYISSWIKGRFSCPSDCRQSPERELGLFYIYRRIHGIILISGRRCFYVDERCG